MQNNIRKYDDYKALGWIKEFTIKLNEFSSPIRIVFYVPVIVSLLGFLGFCFLIQKTKWMELIVFKIPFLWGNQNQSN